MTRTDTSLLGLATLFALGLAAAPAAHAQSLFLSGTDGVTVSSFGTAGTINDGTTAYDDSDQGYAVLTTRFSTFTLEDGGTLTAGHSGDTGLYDASSGAVTISGGTITAAGDGLALEADSNGDVNISGGTLSAGVAGTGLASYSDDAINISGGTLTAGSRGFGLYDVSSAPINISGGTLTAGPGGVALEADGSADVTITGGAFSGGYVALATNYSGAIDVYGNFAGMLPGQIETLPNGYSSFFGMLENNTATENYKYSNFGTLTLHNAAAAPVATPEPSAFVGLGIGLLGLAALAVKARKRMVQTAAGRTAIN